MGLGLQLLDSEGESGRWLMEQKALVGCEAVRDVLLNAKHLCEVHLIATTNEEADALCFAAASTFTQTPPHPDVPLRPEAWVPPGKVGKLLKSQSMDGNMIYSDVSYPKRVGLIHKNVGMPITKKVAPKKDPRAHSPNKMGDRKAPKVLMGVKPARPSQRFSRIHKRLGAVWT